MPRQNLKVIIATLLIAAAAFVLGLKVAPIWMKPPAAATAPALPTAARRTLAEGPSPRPATPAKGTAPGVPVAPVADEAGQALATAIDQLIAPQTTFGQRWALWEQLRKAGRLAEAVGALKQLADQNPNDATLATTLGEAEIDQVRDILEHGGDPNSVSILALQADQNFNAALTLEPTNWEAQFEKAATLAHWPQALGKGPEVLDRLSTLVAQQEASTTPAPPEFALTYALLGEQYRAAGQPEKATQIVQQGLARFPLSTTLQNAAAHAPAP
jgi:tetratricopeptide (TPR) repeat protein